MNRSDQQVSRRALRNALKTSGLTKTEVARRTGVAKSTLSNWLARHRNPTPANLARLAEVLGVEVTDLVSGGRSHEQQLGPRS
jgi:transcriptional regulator with XRE-family HTH domain